MYVFTDLCAPIIDVTQPPLNECNPEVQIYRTKYLCNQDNKIKSTPKTKC